MRQSVKDSWNWWRHNHFMSRRLSFWMTLKSQLGWPLQNLYARCWMRTIGKWKMRWCLKTMKELERKDTQ
jgi:hypothetical protein